MSEEESTLMAFENVFSSKGRIRIIKMLSEVGEMHISGIARHVKLSYTTTNNHLQKLKEAGLVQEKKFGRVRIFRFKNEDQRAQKVKKFIDSWGE